MLRYSCSAVGISSAFQSGSDGSDGSDGRTDGLSRGPAGTDRRTVAEALVSEGLRGAETAALAPVGVGQLTTSLTAAGARNSDTAAQSAAMAVINSWFWERLLL